MAILSRSYTASDCMHPKHIFSWDRQSPFRCVPTRKLQHGPAQVPSRLGARFQKEKRTPTRNDAASGNSSSQQARSARPTRLAVYGSGLHELLINRGLFELAGCRRRIEAACLLPSQKRFFPAHAVRSGLSETPLRQLLRTTLRSWVARTSFENLRYGTQQ